MYLCNFCPQPGDIVRTDNGRLALVVRKLSGANRTADCLFLDGGTATDRRGRGYASCDVLLKR